MCCLANKFPLPIFLLINKCDQIDRVRRTPWMEKFQLENYIKENQFFNHFFVTFHRNDSNSLEQGRESFLSNQSVDAESPLKSMIKTLIQFKDLKEKLINMSNEQINKIRAVKIYLDKSNNNSNYLDEGESRDKKRKKSKSSNCLIL
jgi:hypothetical protein